MSYYFDENRSALVRNQSLGAIGRIASKAGSPFACKEAARLQHELQRAKDACVDAEHHMDYGHRLKAGEYMEAVNRFDLALNKRMVAADSLRMHRAQHGCLNREVI